MRISNCGGKTMNDKEQIEKESEMWKKSACKYYEYWKHEQKRRVETEERDFRILYVSWFFFLIMAILAQYFGRF
jgi:hypothetical protein